VIENHFVIATAGHVDHGKSALVKALTGTDPDRLPEEKARAITIDLGFAHLSLPTDASAQSDSGPSISVSIIDVPGHEDFVRNMIAGLGSIDLALLVVAADDGWMPQTEEHLQILIYLGIKRLVVAVNKSDIADSERTVNQINQQLRGTPYQNAPIVSTCARSAEGIDHLKRALGSVLQTTRPQRDIGKARLLVDRAFNLQGIGSVITGTLTGGTISSRQPVYLQPGNFKTRVRSIQTHRANVEKAEPGMRTGVNLAEIPKHSPISALRRGWVLTTDEFKTTTTLDVLLEKSPRGQVAHPVAQPLKSATSVYLHHATARIPAVLVLSDDRPLRPGESQIGQLRLSSPVLAFVEDRFVIRDRSEQYTIAGGIVLDPNGDPKSFRTVEQQKLLRARAADLQSPAVAVESELIRRGPLPVSSLLRNSNFSEADIHAALADLQKANRVILRGQIAADAQSWRKLREGVINAIERAHETKSEQKGIELTEVRAALSDRAVEVTDALIDDLCSNGFTRRGSVIARATHRPQLPPALQTSATRILAALAEKPFDPPARVRIISTAADQQALRYLIEQEQIVELGPELILSGEAFAEAKRIVARVIAKVGSATVSQLREELQTSRRIAIPLLERFDRDRITRRMGDRRVLVQPQNVMT